MPNLRSALLVLVLSVGALSLMPTPVAALTGAVTTGSYRVDTDYYAWEAESTPAGDLLTCYFEDIASGDLYFAKSSDGGATWSPDNVFVNGQSLNDDMPCDLEVLSEDVYLMASNKQVFRSTNGGTLWNNPFTGTGGYTNGQATYVRLAAYDTDSWSILSVGGGGTVGGYFFTTNNAGVAVSAALLVDTDVGFNYGLTYGATVNDIAVASTDRVFVSTNGGTSFTDCGSAGFGVAGIQDIHYASGLYYFAGRVNGVNSGAGDPALFTLDPATCTYLVDFVHNNVAGYVISEIRSTMERGDPSTLRVAWRSSSTQTVLVDDVGNSDTPISFFTNLAGSGLGKWDIDYISDTLTWGVSRDDWYLLTTPPSGGGPGKRFCADPDLGSSGDWGYDYKEDASFDDNGASGIQFDDFFSLPGSTSDSSYLGKGFEPGSHAWSLRVRTQAKTGEAGQSLLRLAFTTGTISLSEGNVADTGADMTAAGNGQETGNFEDNIQLVLSESSLGTHWVMTMRQSVGGSTLATIGGSVNYGDPQNPGNFIFAVNTGSTPIVGPVNDTETGFEIFGNVTLPAYTATVYDGDYTEIFHRTVPAGLQGAELKDSWLIGKAAVGLGTTAVDDNTDQSDITNSTCIFDLSGESITTGSEGSDPGSFIPTQSSSPTTTSSCAGPFCVTDAEAPEGFTAAAFNGFLGLVMVGMVAVGGVGAIAANNPGFRVGGLVVGIFAFIGYLMAYFFGLLPLWPIVAAVVVGAAILFGKFRSG